MKLVAGLGNPGARYRDTRHNVGFEVVDELARRHRAEFAAGRGESLEARVRQPDVLLLKPLTFMNLSGQAVGETLRYYRVDPVDLLIVTDDVNLPMGRLRARVRGSAGGHNGLASIISSLGTNEFPRLRLGVGRGDARRDLKDHVLGRFEPDEAAAIREMIERAADAVAVFIGDGIAAVMNRFNAEEHT
ncbi:MAG TPA: aminoacyl-tRNA hydrolase [Vicinamibacterales bacterium]